jgi:hypothetical protein
MTLGQWLKGKFQAPSVTVNRSSKNDLSDPREALAAFVASAPSEFERAAAFDAAIDQLVRPMHQAVSWGDRMLTIDKACAFMSDPTFRQSYEAVRGSHLYDAYDSPHTIAWRLNTLVWAARCGLSHQGAFVECGVFKGDMAWVVATVLGKALHDRTFYLYDSFAGFSPAHSGPEDYPDNPGFFDFANRIYKEAGLYETVLAKFTGMPHVRVIRGFLPEALQIAMPERIAFLHIDLNSPAAEIGVLEVLFDRVVTGGVIVFDDYGWKIFHRQREAEDRFMADRGHTILELPTGQGLVVKHG